MKEKKKFPTLDDLVDEVEDLYYTCSSVLSSAETMYDQVTETLERIKRYADREEKRQEKEIDYWHADLDYLQFLTNEAIRSTNQPLSKKEVTILQSAMSIYFSQVKDKNYCNSFNKLLFAAAVRPDGTIHPVVQSYTDFLAAAAIEDSETKRSAQQTEE